MTAGVVRARVLRGRYLDSVMAMRLAQSLAHEAGVHDAAALMATPANLAMLQVAGYVAEAWEGATADDLVVAVKADSEEAASAALAFVEGRLTFGHVALTRPRTLEEALREQPDSNLVSISVPGAFAAAEARRALELGLHVFCFSSDVPLDEEVALKALARANGLLCMGPDCGTSILAGAGLGFSNAVRRGPVGVTGGSGTGIQAVTSLLERMGVGTSAAIGAGSRDLDDAVGGSTTLTALEMLDQDPATQVIVVVSKPGGAMTSARLARAAAASRTPVILCVLGGDGDVSTFDDAARAAARTLGLSAPLPAWTTPVDAAAVAARLGRRGVVRGLFAGGSLCAEAQLVFQGAGLAVTSNAPVGGAGRVGDTDARVGHCLIDLGTATFTRGRPHPMIDARARVARLREEADAPDVAVLLLDVVLGRNAAADPAGDLAVAIADVTSRPLAPVVVTSVVGTEFDPQGLHKQEATLRDAGAIVAPTNATAASWATELVGAMS